MYNAHADLIIVYYTCIDASVLLDNTPFVNSYETTPKNLSDILSISLLVRVSISKDFQSSQKLRKAFRQFPKFNSLIKI